MVSLHPAIEALSPGGVKRLHASYGPLGGGLFRTCKRCHVCAGLFGKLLCCNCLCNRACWCSVGTQVVLPLGLQKADVLHADRQAKLLEHSHGSCTGAVWLLLERKVEGLGMKQTAIATAMIATAVASVIVSACCGKCRCTAGNGVARSDSIVLVFRLYRERGR